MDILPFIIPKTIQYLEINLTKEVKVLYTENFKMLKEKLMKTLEGKKLSFVHG